MSITDRDRKILLALIPLVAIIGYWFLVLAPKRQEASKVKEELSQAEQVRDTAQQKASQLSGAKRSFAADYATVIHLGKSIPASVDMPSLLVQLDRAARGTGIKFMDVKAGARTVAPTAAPAATGTPPGGGTGPTAPGAAPAQSGPGQAAQTASNAVGTANNAAGAAGGSTPPAGGAAGTPGAPGAVGGAPALETVPLDFEFRGSFFDLADFFHRMKRFVRVVNKHIVIRGRLMTINSFSFDTTGGFPQLTAHVNATVYLAPKAQGVDAGASPQGPAPAAGGAAAPAQPASSTPAPPTPTATVTPR
jgi:Tfp pilus assembly protein PilO